MSFENEFLVKQMPNSSAYSVGNIDGNKCICLKKEDAEFIAFTLNLHQRLDIGCYDGTIFLLKEISNTLKADFSKDNISDIIESIDLLINKAKK